MYGCSRTISISDRASRAYNAQAASGTPIRKPSTPGPTIATIAITRTMKGNEIMMSARRETTMSNQPPK